MKLINITVLLLTISVQTLASDRVLLPENYHDTFVENLALDRIQNPDQFIRLFANGIALKGVDKEGELPDGSVLVAEVYSVEKEADGSIKTSMLGRRIRDKLLLVAVMEKQAQFGNEPNSSIQTGDWDFAAYKPNGDVAPKDLNECRACHAPLMATDFLFSIEHLPKAE
jgi:hypothetical protein